MSILQETHKEMAADRNHECYQILAVQDALSSAYMLQCILQHEAAMQEVFSPCETTAVPSDTTGHHSSSSIEDTSVTEVLFSKAHFLPINIYGRIK